jgi:hypothetical protein
MFEFTLLQQRVHANPLRLGGIACTRPRAGTEALACSADMLLEALVVCAGVTMTAVATAVA